jgi:hypothetical protein
LHSNNAEDVFQTIIHLVHPTDGGHGQGVQERCHSSHILASPGEGWAWRPLAVDGGDNDLGLNSGLVEVDGYGPLRLERGLATV